MAETSAEAPAPGGDETDGAAAAPLEGFWRRLLSAGVWPIVLNLVALACALLVVFGAHPALAAVAGLVTVGIMAIRVEWRSFLSRESAAYLGNWPIAQTALVVALAAGAARGSSSAALDVAVVAVGLCVVTGPTLKSMDTAGYPAALNLPGARGRALAVFPLNLVLVANLVAIALLASAVAKAAPAWIALLAALVCVALNAACAWDALARVRMRRYTERNLHRLLTDYGARFALHWQAPAGTAYQASMWLPYLQRLERPWFVLVRTTTNLHDVRSHTDVPIVLRKSLEDLDPVVVPSLRAVFYVNTAVRNSHMVRYSQLTHVQLNHGDSDKAPSFNPVFRMYDRDFVAGRAAIDRFAANGVFMPEQMFTIVGRPQVEDVRPAERPIAEVESPAVLYAPTWSGFYADSDYSSLRVGERLVRALVARGCTVIFRPHPYARRSAVLAHACDAIQAVLAADAGSSGRAHVFGPQAEQTWTVMDCFNASDALVSDVSSVVNDYLFSEKPFAMVAVSEPPSSFRASFPVAEAAYVLDAHSGPLVDLDEGLDALLRSDPLRDRRRQLKTYYLGDIPSDRYAERFIDEARAVVDSPR